MKKAYYLITILLFTQIIFAQQIKRETRAVWISTNFSLDWPPKTYDAETQKNSLKQIFENLHNKHFNTVYFQVRSNGTVMYNSSLEPFSPYLTGIVGGIPEYDPLEFAIELGKKYGIEVHAWINMARCFVGTNENILLSPFHIRNIHPEWTKRIMNNNGTLSYWLNPGLYEVQEYLTRIMLEIASNYDVDGIHLDFFRYPGKYFDDEIEYKKFGNGLTKEDWRRNNLTQILVEFKRRVHPKNPFLKIGITPIGIRKNLLGANGIEGFHSLFQDTEQWLKQNLVDYLTPQIYWTFENNPRFAVLAEDWVKKSYGKNIVLGLAAYKKQVKPELKEMIKLSKKINAAGIAIFRYSDIADIQDSYFSDIAFPPNMEWKYNSTADFNYTTLKPDTIITKPDEVNISFKNFDTTSKNFRYFLLNNFSDNKLASSKLLNPKKNIKLRFVNPKYLTYQYKLQLIDRLWNVVDSSKINISVPYLHSLKKSAGNYTKPLFFNSNTTPFISIFSQNHQDIILEIISKENLVRQVRKELYFGINYINLNINIDLTKKIKIIYNNGKNNDEINFY